MKMFKAIALIAIAFLGTLAPIVGSANSEDDNKLKKAVDIFHEGDSAYMKGVRAYDNGDYSTALREWEKLSKKDNAFRGAALLSIGRMYELGTGVLRDDKEAVANYRRASDLGNAAAQAALGAMYALGRGVTMNQLEAARLYQLSAEKGNSLGQANLGGAYETGSGVQQSYQDAIKWYRLAAEQGSASALNNLGALYFYGRSVKKNQVIAYALFSLAAIKNDDPSSDGVRNRDKLGRVFSTQVLAQARDLTDRLAATGSFIQALDEADR